jgi:hypothetical protein
MFSGCWIESCGTQNLLASLIFYLQLMDEQLKQTDDPAQYWNFARTREKSF